MKKILYRILAAVLLLTLTLTAGLSESFESEEPRKSTDLQPSTKREEPFEVQEGVFYKGYGGTGYQLIFNARESGEYHIYLRTTAKHYIKYYFQDKYGATIDTVRNRNHDDTSPVIKTVELTAGKTYRFEGACGPNCEFMEFGQKSDSFYFAICAPSHHVGPTNEMVVIEEPTCTEPGQKAQCCALCGGYVNTMTIPATGHKTGPEKVFMEATCMSTGLKGAQCEICGAHVTEVTIPMTAHMPDVWMDYRQATCTENGTRIQRCKVCGETLKTETVPAMGHSFTEWTSGEDGKQSRYCVYCGYTENK